MLYYSDYLYIMLSKWFLCSYVDSLKHISSDIYFYGLYSTAKRCLLPA